MSLQRGENVRGWEGVTKDLTAHEAERDAWRMTLWGVILVLLVTGLAALLMLEADLPTVVKAIIVLAVLLIMLKLVGGIYTRMMARVTGAGSDDAGAAARRAEEAKARAAAEAEAKAARVAEEKVAAEKAASEKAAAEKAAAEKAKADAAAAKAAAEAAAAEQAAAAKAAADAGPDRDGDGVAEGTGEGMRPSGLEAARDGKPDDLKLIKGVGPKLEGLCNSLGFWHFDQIANWTSDEIAWVDSNLEGFSGRVSRDNWVAQAKILAAGGETEFSSRQ